MTDADATLGARVRLETFRGTRTSGAERPGEDYWRLIGSTGEIVDDDDAHVGGRHAAGRRVLVRFDCNLGRLELECHNALPDTLWIFISDLVIA